MLVEATPSVMFSVMISLNIKLLQAQRFSISTYSFQHEQWQTKRRLCKKKKSAEKKHQFNEFSVNILFCAPITRQWQQLKLPAKTTKTTKTSEPNNEWQESSVQIDFVCIIYWLALVFLLYTRIEGNEIRIRNSLRVSLHWFFVHNVRWENGAVFGSVNDNNAYIKRLAFIKYFEMKQPIFHFISFQFRFQPDFFDFIYEWNENFGFFWHICDYIKWWGCAVLNC